MLDKRIYELVKNGGCYPSKLVDDLYTASFHLMRNFELAPFANDTKLEDFVSDQIEKGKL